MNLKLLIFCCIPCIVISLWVIIGGGFFAAVAVKENFKIATQKDNLYAMRYAYKKLCEKKPGRKWVDGPNNSWDCLYATKESCLNASIYPTPEANEPHYYEWRDNTKQCVIGNEGFRSWCEKEGLKYEPDTGKCKVTRDHCLKNQLNYCDGDCYQPPLNWLNEQVLGSTLARSLNNISAEKWIIQKACDDAEARGVTTGLTTNLRTDF